MKKLISLILALILVVGCLSGLTFAADAEASYTVDGVTKEGTLAAAVSAVKTKGGTIKLLKDIDFKDEKKSYAIEVNAPITVDLNGNTVTVGSAASFGVIMGEGKLVVAEDALAMTSNGKYLPVYENDGYVFKSIRLWTYNKTNSGDEYVVKFAEYNSREYFKEYIKQGTGKFDVIVRASWITAAGDNAVQDFIFGDEYLAEYAAIGAGFTFKITGVEGKTDFAVEVLMAYQVGNYVVEVFE